MIVTIKPSVELAKLIRANRANLDCSDRHLPDSLHRSKEEVLAADLAEEISVELGLRVGEVPAELANNHAAAALFELGFRKSVAMRWGGHAELINA